MDVVDKTESSKNKSTGAKDSPAGQQTSKQDSAEAEPTSIKGSVLVDSNKSVDENSQEDCREHASANNGPEEGETNTDLWTQLLEADNASDSPEKDKNSNSSKVLKESPPSVEHVLLSLNWDPVGQQVSIMHITLQNCSLDYI